jgi:D-alanyl-D-alanine carboxypeptidase
VALAACAVDAAAPEPTTTAPPAAPAPSTTSTTTTASTSTTAPPSTSAPPTTVPVAPPALDAATARRFADALGRRELAAGAPAVQIAVTLDGRTLASAAYGTADPTTGRQASTGDRFRIASISKTLTATVALQLVEAGTWSLDDTPLAALARELGTTVTDPRISTITLRELLSHTSGFDVSTKLFFSHGATDCRDAARQSLRARLEADPASRYEYSNLNFCLLGLLLEQQAGAPYADVVQRRLLGPLGIDDMRMAGTFDVRPGDVVHATTPGRNYMETLGAAGAWISTASDVATILDSLDVTTPGWHPLDATWAAAMRTPVARPDPPEDFGYGLGLFVWDDGTWGHTGSVESARSIAVRSPDGVTVVMLASALQPYDTNVLRSWIAEAMAEARGTS